MLQSTYKDEPQKNVGQYSLDIGLSSNTVLVYVDPLQKEVKITIRGTKGAADWVNNILYATKTGLQRLTPRFTNAQKVVDNARAKYPGYTFEFLGHSQGSVHARDLAKSTESIVSVNPATKGEYTPNEQVIRNSGDAISSLGILPSWYKNLTKTNKDITTSYNPNPIEAHRLDTLDELGQTVVGAGVRCSCCGDYIK